jgi:pimeloyl-ACP methyl ester carboxylesterase
MSRPVLLVHGAWHGPWCWNDWVHALADRGDKPLAVTLPGHDRPGSSERIWNRLGEYVDQVVSQLRFLGPDTVVVGHSMGGLVTQKALETAPAALGILVASVPPSGVLGATVRTAKRRPLRFALTNATLSMHPIVANEKLTREAFFTSDADGADVERCADLLQNESFLAYLEMFAVRPNPRKISTPIRVIAAEHDAIFSLKEQRQLARRYRTELQVIEGAGHDLMMGPWSSQALDVVTALIDDLPSVDG